MWIYFNENNFNNLDIFIYIFTYSFTIWGGQKRINTTQH